MSDNTTPPVRPERDENAGAFDAVDNPSGESLPVQNDLIGSRTPEFIEPETATADNEAEPVPTAPDSAGPRVDETPGFVEPANVPDHVHSTNGTVEHVVPAAEEEAAPPELVNPPAPLPAARLEMPEIVTVPAAASVPEIGNTAVLPPVEQPVVVPVAAPAQTYYVEAPVPPRKKSNRGVGTLIALLATLIFAGLFAVAIATIRAVRGGGFAFGFFTEQPYYIPVIFFAVGFILLVLLANRAGWWAHVFGSIFVGLFVYFGTIGTLLLIAGVVSLTPNEARVLFDAALSNPFEIAAALIAREVALWMGLAVSARGRRVKSRNAEARAAYDVEVADKRTEYDRINGATA